MNGLGLPADFEAKPAGGTQKILFAHRRSGADDIYFVANHLRQAANFTGVFRVRGKTPQAWNPETGAITALPGFSAKQDRIEVPLKLEAYGSLFVVFRNERPPKTKTPGLVTDSPVVKKSSGRGRSGFN